jgi:hypothetical protein
MQILPTVVMREEKEKVGNQMAGLERFIIRKCVKKSVGLFMRSYDCHP